MTVKSLRLRAIVATALAIVLVLPASGFANDVAGTDDWHSVLAALQPGTALDIRLKDGQRIHGNVQAVINDGLMMEHRSQGGVTHRLVSFNEMQMVTKPGIGRWWHNHKREVVLVVVAAVAVGVVIYVFGARIWSHSPGTKPNAPVGRSK
jgi:hypothetical protein